MDRAQKEALVKELGQIFTDSGVVVVSHYAGITVAEMQDFRSRMRDVGGSVRVAKNKLAKIALEGKPCENISGLFEKFNHWTHLKALDLIDSKKIDNENLLRNIRRVFTRFLKNYYKFPRRGLFESDLLDSLEL